MSDFESGELRANVEKGLKKDETTYIQELGQYLDAYGFNTGVQLDLGDEPDAVQRVNDLLGVDESLEDGSLDIVSVSVSNSYSTSVKGSLRPFVKEVGIIAALPIIQAEVWPDSTFPRLHSLITAGSVIEGSNGESELDKNRPVIEFSAVGIYTSAMQKKFAAIWKDVLPTYAAEDEVASTVAKYGVHSPAIAYGRYLGATHTDMEVPVGRYSVSIGRPNYGFWSSAVVARTENRYALKNGHIVYQRTY